MFCNGVISPGVKYERTTCLYDGCVYDWVNHSECSLLASKLDMFDYDEGLTGEVFRENIFEYVHEKHYDEEMEDICEEWQGDCREVVLKILEELK